MLQTTIAALFLLSSTATRHTATLGELGTDIGRRRKSSGTRLQRQEERSIISRHLWCLVEWSEERVEVAEPGDGGQTTTLGDEMATTSRSVRTEDRRGDGSDFVAE